MQKRIERAAKAVLEGLGNCEVGIILGSGLGAFVECLAHAKSIPFSSIPDFARATVPGHQGQLVAGTLGSRRVLAMQGRFHYYEGYSAQEVTFPVRVMQATGVKTLIVTNAAGAVNTSFAPGDLMLIEDFLNLSGVNPLRGENLSAFGPRFPDMTYAMDRALGQNALTAAQRLGRPLVRGVYAQMQGPSYETPAEIRMVRLLGGDAVGMSTVPEIIVARHGGMRVLGLSCISNMAAGIVDQPLSHEEVVEIGKKTQQAFSALLQEVIETME